MVDSLKVISKVVGVAAAGLMLYDATKAAKVGSDKAQSNSLQDRLPDQFMATTKLDTESAITAKIKEKTFEWQLDNNIPEFFASIRGYCEGLIENLAGNIIPATLATGALLLPKGGKICALGLLAVGAKRLLYDIWGIGKQKPSEVL